MEALISQDTDIVSTIVNIINSLCSNLFSSIDKHIFPLLDEIIFIDNQILNIGSNMNKLLSNSPSSGILLLANSLFTGFVLYYCARLVIANLTGNIIESPHKFFMRAFLAGIAMNYAMSICRFLINSTNMISSFFCNLGESIFNKEISFVSLTSILNESVPQIFDAFSLDGILSRNAFNFCICTHHKLFI